MDDEHDNPYKAPREVAAPSESLAQAKRVDKRALRLSIVSLLSAVIGTAVLVSAIVRVGFSYGKVYWFSVSAILMCIAVGTGIEVGYASIRARRTLPAVIGVIGFVIGASGISLLIAVS